MVKKYTTYLSESMDSDTAFTRNHSQWCSMYPELEQFEFDSDYVDGKLIWRYALEKESVEMYLEIKKSNNSWELGFEMFVSEEGSEQEKHYGKSGLDMNKFQVELSHIAKIIKNNLE
jgi:hypothetical protein